MSPCLFNLWLEEAQAGIKTARRNINNLKYADDPTHIPESEEKINSFLMKVKEESEKAGLKCNIQETKNMASGPITSRQINGGKLKQWQILFSWAPKSLWTLTAATKLRDTCSLEGRKAMKNLHRVLKSRDSLC